jgi:V/A-type H+/Na+-transporting ATPase subunit I
MASEKMKRLKLVAAKSEREDLFRELMILGCVHIPEQETEFSDLKKTGSFFRESSGLDECKSEYVKILRGIELLNKHVPAKMSFFKKKPKVSRQMLLDEASLRDSLELSDKILTADEKIEGIKYEESTIKGTLETLKPWSSLDIPFDLKETETCFLLPGIVPASVKLIYLEKNLSAEVPESQLLKVLSDREAHYIILVAMKENQQSVLEMVQQFSFEPLSVGDMKGTAGESISELKKRLAELDLQKKELAYSIRAMSASRNELKLCADRLLTKAEKAENEERLLCTEYTINLEGWIPANDVKRLTSVLSGFDCAWELTEPTKDEAAIVPFKLRHGLFYRLFKRKLYRAGRKPFRPLTIRTSYVNIIKEN